MFQRLGGLVSIALLALAACGEVVSDEATTCEEDYCGEHALDCVEGASGPECTCYDGYAGPRCEACALGYEDADGTCEPEDDGDDRDDGDNGDDGDGDDAAATWDTMRWDEGEWQ